MLVDEAYFEFYGESLLEYVGQVPNLFVARTFSKAYGMAGLRVGVLVGAAEQMQSLRRACSPYNVNGVALACLPAALADQEYVRQLCGRSACEPRARWKKSFAVLRNSLLAEPGKFCAGADRAQPLRSLSEACGRAAFWCATGRRDFGCEGCVRITAGWREHTDRLLGALHETLKEIGWGERRPA